MKTVCTFDKEKDLGKVIKGLAPDIQAMIDSHNIPTTSSDLVYNQIEDIKSVGFRVNDEFEAIMLSRKLHASAGIENNGGTASSNQIGGLGHE